MSKKRRRGPVDSGADVLGPLQDIIRQVRKGRLVPAQVQAFAEGRNPFSLATSSEPLEEWGRYFQQEFGIRMPDNLTVPQADYGFDWIVVEKTDLSYAQIVARARTRYQLWLYNENLDEAVPAQNELQSKDWIQQGCWRVVRCRETEDADSQNVGRSATDLDVDELSSQVMNLRQRLLLGDQHFLKTKRHLDRSAYTLCAASRNRDGNVPGVHWYPSARKVNVYWCLADSRPPCLRARSVQG